MSAQSVLDVARSQIGTVESPPGSNRTRYGRDYGMDGNAWCAMFVWWCFQKGGEGAAVPKAAYTPAIADHFRQLHQWGQDPRVGALALFDFPGDGVNRISHIALVEEVHPDGSVTTIEGNTSSGRAGSQRDGGGVWRRVRRAGIVGFAYPAYSGAPVAGRPILREGSRGQYVADLQARLGFTGRDRDGDFGPKTRAAVVAFQRAHGLDPDGVVGPATWKALG